MNKSQFYTGIFLAAVIGGLIVLAGVRIIYNENLEAQVSISERQHLQLVNYANDDSYIVPDGLNFISAAEKVTPGVVHIRSIYSNSTQSGNVLDNFFRPYGGGAPTQSAGSGVIISDQGYIVTNNHVVKDVSKIGVKKLIL